MLVIPMSTIVLKVINAGVLGNLAPKNLCADDQPQAVPVAGARGCAALYNRRGC